MKCPDCGNKMIYELKQDATGKRYFHVCPVCKKKIEVRKKIINKKER